jgi:hypothetical protein
LICFVFHYFYFFIDLNVADERERKSFRRDTYRRESRSRSHSRSPSVSRSRSRSRSPPYRKRRSISPPYRRDEKSDAGHGDYSFAKKTKQGPIMFKILYQSPSQKYVSFLLGFQTIFH